MPDPIDKAHKQSLNEGTKILFCPPRSSRSKGAPRCTTQGHRPFLGTLRWLGKTEAYAALGVPSLHHRVASAPSAMERWSPFSRGRAESFLLFPPRPIVINQRSPRSQREGARLRNGARGHPHAREWGGSPLLRGNRSSWAFIMMKQSSPGYLVFYCVDNNFVRGRVEETNMRLCGEGFE